MALIRSAEARRTETPNAVMTTLVSPAQGGGGHALWRVDAAAGSAGPLHTNTDPQVWTLLTGRATVDIDGEATELTPGDTLRIPADLPRRVIADPATGYTAICMGPADAHVTTPGNDPIPLPWAR